MTIAARLGKELALCAALAEQNKQSLEAISQARDSRILNLEEFYDDGFIPGDEKSGMLCAILSVVTSSVGALSYLTVIDRLSDHAPLPPCLSTSRARIVCWPTGRVTVLEYFSNSTEFLSLKTISLATSRILVLPLVFQLSIITVGSVPSSNVNSYSHIHRPGLFSNSCPLSSPRWRIRCHIHVQHPPKGDTVCHTIARLHRQATTTLWRFFSSSISFWSLLPFIDIGEYRFNVACGSVEPVLVIYRPSVSQVIFLWVKSGYCEF